MAAEPKQQEWGQSWQDCSEVAAFVWSRYGQRADIRLVQSVRRLDGKGNSSWQAVVTITPREGAPGKATTTTESWGQGGTAKTAPQAIYRCLTTLCEILEARERDAAKQASF